eukprot:3339919-Rhodomonas_salina.1
MVLGGGGVGARLGPGIKHSATISGSGVRGGRYSASQQRQNINRLGASRHASIRQASHNLKRDPALLEGGDGNQPLQRLEQSLRMYHALWLSPTK